MSETANDERETANSGATDDERPEVGGRLTARNGGYSRRENGEWVEVANFQIDPIAYLKTPNGWVGGVIVRTPEGERDRPMFVRPANFNSTRRFKNKFAGGLTTIFRGNVRDVNALKRFVGREAAKLERDE